MTIKTISDINLEEKRVIIREDLNVPIKDGVITSDKRIRAALPTIQKAIKENAKVIIVSHLGRPEEGVFDEKYSLAPVAKKLSQMLEQDVPLIKDWINGVSVDKGKVVLCENVRFLKGEKKNDEELGKKIASLCDVFVMDAFAVSHRAQASTCGAIKFSSVACTGFLLESELDALGKILESPNHPLLAIVGGSKVSTKLSVLENLLTKVDQLIVGGGIANTFIAARGYNIGKSLYEEDLIPEAERLISLAKEKGAEIPLPIDVVVAKECSETAHASVKKISDITDDEMILDIGPETIDVFSKIVEKAKTVLWNGPVGVFEINQFGQGTKSLANSIAKGEAFSVAGGGDTVAAIEKYNLQKEISYISTAGGAFLEFIEGKTLPVVASLNNKN